MISNEFIAKIEGHGSLNINWQSSKVKLFVHEGERLFEGILVGRPAEEAYWITPRICGVCPIAHNLASVRAVESAYGVKESEGVKQLRDLMVCGQMIQSHVLHFFFLALPDYIGIDRGTELAKKDSTGFAMALSLKELGDEIAKTVAGRNVHPTTTTIGGFHKVPEKEDLEKLLIRLAETKEAAEWTVKMALGLDYPKLEVDLELACIKDGQVVTSKKNKFSIKDYKSNIEEEIRENSTAKFGRLKGREMLVGSLARLILGQSENYSEKVKKYISKLDSQNPFHNNLAQAIEILHFHQEAERLARELLKTKIEIAPEAPALKGPSVGFGAVEAPRGGLYNEIHLDGKGIITYANIITPTVQNLTSIEKSAQTLLDASASLEQKERERLLNMLVRAYDPCITCAVH